MSSPYRLPRLVDEPDDWERRALCAQVGGDLWFPNREAPDTDTDQLPGVSVKAAKEVCAKCPVRRPCLDAALANHERWGVWGALTPRERQHVANGSAVVADCDVCHKEFLSRNGAKRCTEYCRKIADSRRHVASERKRKGRAA